MKGVLLWLGGILLVTGGAGHADSRYYLDLSVSAFEDVIEFESGEGFDLIDIEWRDGLIGGIWMEVEGTTHLLFDAPADEWQAYLEDMADRRGRFLDFEVYYVGTERRYMGIFLEDGDDYAFSMRTTNLNDEFQERLKENYDAGRQIIDFESYTTPQDTTVYAGCWVDDPNQPRTSLYHDLESADVSDLLRPLHGRIIDYERYWSATHDEYRHALIVAQVPGDEWALWRNQTRLEFDQRHIAEEDADTFLIDIEQWTDDEGEVRHAGVWGDAAKTLDTVAGIPDDPIEAPPSTRLAEIIDDFEGDTIPDRIGFYGKNIRAGRSIGYRQDESFYLASVAKFAMHIRLWREIQAGNIAPMSDTIQYTLGPDTPEPWYVDDRFWPGLSSCVCNTTTCLGGRTSDFGQDISIDRLDRAMMQVSDNAATSMLMDDETFGLTFDSPDINTWLAGVEGVGQGWGVLTSIQKLDRLIMWQGQVQLYPDHQSFWRAEPWRLEPFFRNCGVEAFGNPIVDFYGERPFYSKDEGYPRYYNMNLNSATPRATMRLYEKLWRGEMLDTINTALCFQNMGGSLLNNDPRFPRYSIRGKGGSKGGQSSPVCDTAIVMMGPDAVVLGAFSKDNVGRTNATIRNDFFVEIGYELFRELTPDVVAANYDADNETAPALVFPTEQIQGGTVSVSFGVENQTGGPMPAFPVELRLSENKDITVSDPSVGTFTLEGVDGNDSELASINFTIPDSLDPGEYHIGFTLDPGTDPIFGANGEFDETNNNGVFTFGDGVITVKEPESPPAATWRAF